MKRALAFFLTVVMLLSLFPSAAFAQGNIDGLTLETVPAAEPVMEPAAEPAEESDGEPIEILSDVVIDVVEPPVEEFDDTVVSPQDNYVTVTFDMNGCGEQTEPQTLIAGTAATEPEAPEAEGYSFSGWYTEPECVTKWDFAVPVNEDTVLYACWVIDDEVREKEPTSYGANYNYFQYDSSHYGEEYADDLKTAIKNAKEHSTITLQRDWDASHENAQALMGRTSTLDLNGHSITGLKVEGNGDLTIIGSGTIYGLSMDNCSKVFVESDNVCFKAYDFYSYTATVILTSGSCFTLKKGNIQPVDKDGNVKNSGVIVFSDCTFNMIGGSITNPTEAYNSNTDGAAVENHGIFDMSGGTISGHHANLGGAVYSNGTFTMSGGEISGNEANLGGAVYSFGSFTMSGGEISGNTATGTADTYVTAGGVFVAGGTFEMTGGSIKNNTALPDFSCGGGGVGVAGGTFTMSGGEISGNNAHYGGGVYVYYYTTFNQSGGKISGNTAKETGGGVHVVTSGTFNQSGGEISGNTSPNGGVYVNSDGTLNVSGTAKITGNTANGTVPCNLYLVSGKTVNVSAPLTDGASIGVTAEGAMPRVIAYSAGVYASKFFSDNTSYVILYSGGNLVIDTPPIKINETGATYATLAEAVAAAANGQTIVLLNNSESSDKLDFPSDKTLTLDLNGKTFAVGDWGVTILGTVTVKDSTEAKNGCITTNNNVTHHRAACAYGGKLILESGNISGCTASDASSGVAVCIDKKGIFEMKGGKLTNNTSTGGGGAVYVLDGSFTMSGGEISGNTAPLGGGVFVENGSFTMSGGVISGNTAPTGGGVSMQGGSFTMSGGKLSGNTSSDCGGAVYISGGSFTMSDGEISGNKGKYGGGVELGGGSFTMSGGKISGNTGTAYGGGVHIYIGSVTVTGGEISGNTSPCGGISIQDGTFTMSGGSVTDNTSPYGGVYYFGSGTVNVSGTAKISGNTTDGTDSCNLYLASGKIANVSESLTEGADIGVTLADGMGAVTDSNTANYAPYFNADNVSYVAYNSGTDKAQVVKLGVKMAVSVADGITDGTLSVDKTEAAYGETVTVTAIPSDEFYKLTSLTYTPVGGKAVTVEKTGDVWSFTMPKAEVTVSASFAVKAHDVTLSYDSTLGTAELTGSKTAYEEDETVSVNVTVTDTENYRIKEVKAYKTGDEDTTVEITGSEGTYTFTMPDYAVTVSAEYELIPYFTAALDEYDPIIGQANIVNSGTEGSFKAGEKVYVVAVPSEYGKAETPRVFKSDDEETELSFEEGYFIMPEFDVIIDSGLREIPAFTVSFEYDDTMGTAALSGTKTRFMSGETASFNVSPFKDYEVVSVKAYNTEDPEETFEVTNDSVTLTNIEDTFEMTVEVTFERRDHALNVDTGTGYGYVQDAIDEAKEGQTVRVLMDSDENIVIYEDDVIIIDLDSHDINGGGKGSTVTVNGTLTVKDSKGSGSITGGSGTELDSVSCGGGLIVNSGAAFTFERGSIIGNTASRGAAVYVAEGASFNFDGGSIIRNKGNAVYNLGTVTQANGNITANTATENGGVYNAGTYTMTRGSISANTAPGFDNEGNFTVGGMAVITGNGAENLYLPADKTVSVSGTVPFAAGALIGVTTQSEPAEEVFVPVTDENEDNYELYFISDKGYTVINDYNTVKLALAPLPEPVPYRNPIYINSDDPVYYIRNWESATADYYTLVTDETTELSGSVRGGRYVVNGEVTVTDLSVSGDVKLILTDGSILNAGVSAPGKRAVEVPSGSSLTVYSQSELEATMGRIDAVTGGIGGEGKLTVNGGIINAASSSGAAIGSGAGEAAAHITINGGIVNATATGADAAIGSGSGADASFIVINGGSVTANAVDGAAIGSGENGDVSNITVNAGTVNATATGSGAAIGAGASGDAENIFINGAIITAKSSSAAVIGCTDGTASVIRVSGNLKLEADVNTSGENAVNIEHTGDEDLTATLSDKKYAKTEYVPGTAHTHDWSYSVSATNSKNDTLNAVCSGTSGVCSAVDTTLVISYDANEKTAKLSANTFAGKTAPQIYYKGTGTTEYAKSVTAPSKQGTYRASISITASVRIDAYESAVMTYTAYVDFTVPGPTVTFETYGGTAIPSRSVDTGAKAEKPDDPTRTNSSFRGWTLNGTDYDFDTAVTESITLCAKWRIEATEKAIVAAEDADNKTTGTVRLDSNTGARVTGFDPTAKSLKDNGNKTNNVMTLIKVNTVAYSASNPVHTAFRELAVTKSGKENVIIFNTAMERYINYSLESKPTGTDDILLEIEVPVSTDKMKDHVLYTYETGTAKAVTVAEPGSADYGKNGTCYIEKTGGAYDSIHIFTYTFGDYCIGYIQDDSGMSLSLNGDIGVNFYIDVDYYLTAAEKDGAYVELWYNHNNTSYSTDITADTLTVPKTGDSKGRCKFSCSVVPAQMVDAMKAVLYKKDGTEVYCKDSSINDYFNTVFTKSTNEKMKALCVAMRDYGTACQSYFSYNTGNLANGGNYGNRLYAATTAGIKNYEYSDANIRGASFMAQSRSSIRLYFYSGTYGTAVCDRAGGGFMTAGLGSSDSGSYAAVTNIPAARLDENFVLTLDGSVTISGSALSFARRVLETSPNTKLITLAKAMILYNAAAKDYFASK